MQLKVWITMGEHWNVPGTPLKVCASKELADKEAADLVNIMLDDCGMPQDATADNWSDKLKPVTDLVSGVWVDVTEHEVIV